MQLFVAVIFFNTWKKYFAAQFSFTSLDFYYPKEGCLVWNYISILLTRNLINIYKLICLRAYILF